MAAGLVAQGWMDVPASEACSRLWLPPCAYDQYTLVDFHERIKHVKNCTTHIIPDTSHMLHHDKPEELARSIEKFLLS